MTKSSEVFLNYRGHLRNSTAWIAMGAWVMTMLFCPLAAAVANPSTDYGIHHLYQDVASLELGFDSCCQLLGHTNTVTTSFTGVKAAIVPSPTSSAIGTPASVFAVSRDRMLRSTLSSDNPPPIKYQRFATFWSHAPPTNLG